MTETVAEQFVETLVAASVDVLFTEGTEGVGHDWTPPGNWPWRRYAVLVDGGVHRDQRARKAFSQEIDSRRLASETEAKHPFLRDIADRRRRFLPSHPG